MSKIYWILAIILIVVVIGYFGRSRIQTILKGTPLPPIQTQTKTPSSTSSATATASAKNADIIMTKSNSTKGNYVAGPNGMALYIFDKDTPGVSNCSGSCTALWPPYTTISPADILPTNIGLIKQTNGISQYTYKGMPLYFYTPDKQPGDVTGDGVGGVWHLVKP
ncbi:MAG: hypothetical protein Q7R82_00785 [Candidatus Daviesbacteria bacterium]|nr:hypothetical protein [Candidatus Daviesbacteria bacterium]